MSESKVVTSPVPLSGLDRMLIKQALSLLAASHARMRAKYPVGSALNDEHGKIHAQVGELIVRIV